MVGIIDYGMGNLSSVKNALDYLGEDSIISSKPSELSAMDKLILPGIGGFPDCMKNLKNNGLINSLQDLVIGEKKPIMGICLGMQVMGRYGHEFEKSEGLGWFDAEVVHINTVNDKVKIPNVGWEDVLYNKSSPLFKNLPRKVDFYLVHSYFMKFEDEDTSEIDAYYEIEGLKITAAVRRDNIFATQFHPEKSSDIGMTVLENFIDW